MLIAVFTLVVLQVDDAKKLTCDNTSFHFRGLHFLFKIGVYCPYLYQSHSIIPPAVATFQPIDAGNQFMFFIRPILSLEEHLSAGYITLPTSVSHFTAAQTHTLSQPSAATACRLHVF
ncbi:hypothetical protein [Vibrio owensii]